MSVPADRSPIKLLELPSTWLAHLIQHVAPGPGGLASAAALSQTCKSFYVLSESSAVTYRNIHVDKPLLGLDHPFWPWLAKRHSRVAGLTAQLRLSTVAISETEPEHLQMMFGIAGLHLTLCCNDVISTSDDPFMAKVLRPHSHLIDHLTSAIISSGARLNLQDFCQAAAPCRSLDLTVQGALRQGPLNMGDLEPVAGSLVRLHLQSNHFLLPAMLPNVSSLSLLSQLTSLSLHQFNIGGEEPLVHLAGLTNLKQLSLRVAASGDPSSLSALTGLTSLEVDSFAWDGLLSPCTFSSMQPLSTLGQLKELTLHVKACSATSLHGLAELSKLKGVTLNAPMLRSLEGICTGLKSLTIQRVPQLDSLAGIEHLQRLQFLTVTGSAVSSLWPLAALGSLERLFMGGVFTSLAGLEGNLCTC